MVLDVGANIGYCALMYATKVGPTGNVYALEPEPGSFQLLVDNIRLNDGEAIIPAWNLAAFDSAGTETMYVSEYFSRYSFKFLS